MYACTQYSPSCSCSACQQLRAFSATAQSGNWGGFGVGSLGTTPVTQGSIKSFEPNRNNSAREMTAEDIGLHPDFLRRMEHERALDATLARLSAERTANLRSSDINSVLKRMSDALKADIAAQIGTIHIADAPYAFWLGDLDREQRRINKWMWDEGFVTLREPA